MDWYIITFKRYMVFSGRSTRKEFWFFTLINMLINSSLVLLFFSQPTLSRPLVPQEQVLVIILAFNLLTFLPSLGVMIRRLHDTNRTGWLVALNVIPVLGTFLLMFFLSLEGSIGDNRFGDDPSWVTSRSTPISFY